MRLAIVVPDGMADRPEDSPGAPTPLEEAATPFMDALAREGILGRAVLVPREVAPGSDAANLAVLGLDPRAHRMGRAALEAAGRGIDLAEDEVVFRMNLVTIRDGILVDYSGGGVSSDEARRYVAAIGEALAREGARIVQGVGYRHLLVLEDPAGATLNVACRPPHDIQGRKVEEFLASGSGEGAGLVRRLQDAASAAVARVAPAGARGPNAVWLWGQGRRVELPSLRERFGVRKAAVVGAVDLVRGVGRAMGMEAMDVPGATGDLDTNYAGKGEAAARALGDCELVLVHVEAPDEASHRGDRLAKLRAIEAVDREVVSRVWRRARELGRTRVLVVPDHLTPLSTRTHAHGAVPFALWGPGVEPSGSSGLSERQAASSGVYVERGWELLGLALADALSPWRTGGRS